MIHIWCNGKLRDLTRLNQDDFDLEYVAGVLAKLNRFAGHTQRPYSVAQHAVLTSYLAQPGFEYEALHHDDEEAFGGDIISPLKSANNRTLFGLIRARCVAPALGLKWFEPRQVKAADTLALQVEQVLVQGRPYDDGLAEGWFVAENWYVKLLTAPWPWRVAKWVYLWRHWVLARRAT